MLFVVYDMLNHCGNTFRYALSSDNAVCLWASGDSLRSMLVSATICSLILVAGTQVKLYHPECSKHVQLPEMQHRWSQYCDNLVILHVGVSVLIARREDIRK